MTVIWCIASYLVGFVAMASAIRKTIPTAYREIELSTAKIRCIAVIMVILWPVTLVVGSLYSLFDHFIPPPEKERQ